MDVLPQSHHASKSKNLKGDLKCSIISRKRRWPETWPTNLDLRELTSLWCIRGSRTERTAALVEAQMSTHGISAEEAEKRMASDISIGRMIDAEEIAYVITFLASPKSVAINGDAVATAGGSGRAIHY